MRVLLTMSYNNSVLNITPTVIRSGLDSLGLVSLTSEALLSAMTWLAVHKVRSQII